MKIGLAEFGCSEVNDHQTSADCRNTQIQLDYQYHNQGTISLKHLGGTLATQLMYFVLKKKLPNFNEMSPWISIYQRSWQHEKWKTVRVIFRVCSPPDVGLELALSECVEPLPPLLDPVEPAGDPGFSTGFSGAFSALALAAKVVSSTNTAAVLLKHN